MTLLLSDLTIKEMTKVCQRKVSQVPNLTEMKTRSLKERIRLPNEVIPVERTPTIVLTIKDRSAIREIPVSVLIKADR